MLLDQSPCKALLLTPRLPGRQPHPDLLTTCLTSYDGQTLFDQFRPDIVGGILILFVIVVAAAAVAAAAVMMESNNDIETAGPVQGGPFDQKPFDQMSLFDQKSV